jgi:hypothetical protein
MTDLTKWDQRQRATGFYHGYAAGAGTGVLLLAVSGAWTAAACWTGVSLALALIVRVRAAQDRKRAARLIHRERHRSKDGVPFSQRAGKQHIEDLRLANTLWRMPTEEEPKEKQS